MIGAYVRTGLLVHGIDLCHVVYKYIFSTHIYILSSWILLSLCMYVPYILQPKYMLHLSSSYLVIARSAIPFVIFSLLLSLARGIFGSDDITILT